MRHRRPRVGRAPDARDRRRPRLLEDRGRQAARRNRSLRHGGRPGTGAGHRGASGHAPGPDAARRRAARAAAAPAGRPAPSAPGPDQPPRQRREVHQGRRGRPCACPRRDVAGGVGGRARGRDRHGRRHRAGGARPPVPGLRAGRWLDDAALRRHRPRPGYHAPAGRADGRHSRRHQRAWRRQHVLVRADAAGRGREPSRRRFRPARSLASWPRQRSRCPSRRRQSRQHRGRRRAC